MIAAGVIIASIVLAPEVDVAVAAVEGAVELGEAAEVAVEVSESTSSFFDGTEYTPKIYDALKGSGEFHSFPESVRAFEGSGTVSSIIGADGAPYQVLRIPGSYLSVNETWYEGEFQFIKNSEGFINHRLFVPTPIAPVGP